MITRIVSYVSSTKFLDGRHQPVSSQTLDHCQSCVCSYVLPVAALPFMYITTTILVSMAVYMV